MQKVIAPEKRDPDLVAKLTTQAELEGLLVCAVEALRRLMERGRFEIPQAVQDAGRDYREELDSVAGWLADYCDVRDPQAVTQRTALYASYQAWCQANGHRFQLKARAVYDRLRQHPNLEETAHDGVRQFKGVKIR